MLKALCALGAMAIASALVVPTASLANTASDDSELVQASVSYGDLNLAHPSGVQTLRFRIDSAAKSVCGTPYAFELHENVYRRGCINGAVASAQPEFDRAVRAARRGSVTISAVAALTVAARR